MISEQIFRAYDIRGIFGEDLTEEVALKIGKALASYVSDKRKDFVVGRDVRLSSKPVGDAFIEGMLSGGLQVEDIGLVTTPLLYFASVHYGKAGGIMVTASHNPPEWNGLKIWLESGFIGMGMGMEELRDIATKGKFKSSVRGRLKENHQAISDYEDYVAEKIEVKRKTKVVADPGNGSCSLLIPSLFHKVGIDVKAINAEADGRFPAHSPEPSEATLHDVKKLVLGEDADLGVGFDGDGDRALFIDDKGRLVPDSAVLVVLAEHYLKKQRGVPIVYEVSCSMNLEETIRKYGGKPVSSRVGHTYIGEKMQREKAPFGGETSGHFYFLDVYGFDDALYATLKLCEILSKSDRRLSEIVDATPMYPRIPGKKFDCPDEKKFKIVEELSEDFKNMGFGTTTIDGVKVADTEGWFLIRASNTQPVVRLTVEAKTQKALKRLADIAERKIVEKTKA